MRNEKKVSSHKKRRLIDTYVTKIKPAPEETRPSSTMRKFQQANADITKSQKEAAVSATS